MVFLHFSFVLLLVFSFFFLTKNGSNQQVFLLLHRLLPILNKEDYHLEKILANLSDVSLVYDQPENLFSGVKHLGTIRLKKEHCTIKFKPFKHMEAQEISHAVPPNLHSLTYFPSLLYIRRNDLSASIRLSSLSTTIPDTSSDVLSIL